MDGWEAVGYGRRYRTHRIRPSIHIHLFRNSIEYSVPIHFEVITFLFWEGSLCEGEGRVGISNEWKTCRPSYARGETKGWVFFLISFESSS